MYITGFIVNAYIKNNDNIKKIEEKFNVKIRDTELKKIISMVEAEPIFFSDDDFYRLLSLQEILNIEQDIQISFQQENVLPIIDCGNNDYFAYDFNNYCWCRFNSVINLKYTFERSILKYFYVEEYK